MAEDFGTPTPTPITPLEEPKKKSNTTLIIVIVVLVLLLCCCLVGIGGWWLWNNGDRFFSISLELSRVLL